MKPKALVMSILVLSLLSGVTVSDTREGKFAAIRISNFGCVNENYFRGAQPAKRDYIDLARLGIKTVIDLQSDGSSSESALVTAAGMRFFRIGLTTHTKPAMEQVEQFLNLVNDPANQPVYVHCKGGRHRTGIMTAVYRIAHDNWSADQAFAEMCKYEFEKGWVSHDKLKSFVYEYYDRKFLKVE